MWVVRLGVWRSWLVHTGLAVVLSIAITYLVLLFLGLSLTPGIPIAAVASFAVAAPLTMIMTRLVYQLAVTEGQLSEQLGRKVLAEDALIESEERFRRSFEDAAIGMTIIDLDGSIRLANETFCDMLGYEQRELVQLTVYDITHPDDRSKSERNRRLIRENESSARSEAKRYLHKNGSVIWGALTRSVVKAEDGQALYTIGQVQDVTEQRAAFDELQESEERYRQLVETTRVIPWELNLATWRFTYVGPQAKQVLGYEVEEWYGEGFWPEHIHPDDVDYAVEYCKSATARNEDHVFEYRMVSSGGEVVWLRDLVSVISDGDEPRHLRGFMIDISTQKEMEMALRQAQKMELVGQLTGGIAHDFNNLLMGIMGNLELISMRIAEDDDLRARVDRAISATERGGSLTNKLLAFSRTQTLNPESTDVPALVEHISDLLARALGENVTLEFDWPSDLPQVRVDRHQLEHAFLNLTVNARDAIAGSGTIRIAGQRAHLEAIPGDENIHFEPGHFVQISVSDDGSGMSEETLERAFEPFFTTKEIGAGSGLGLSMVFGFVQQSGGHIELSSEPGRGTAVTMYLPVADAANKIGKGESAQSWSPLPRGSGERVYLVEDDLEVRDATARMLAELGYDVVDGSDGSDSLLRSEEFAEVDVLLSDIALPNDLDGLKIAERAKKENPSIHVLLMTGHADRLADPDGFLRLKKPFKLDELAYSLDAVLQDRS